MSQPQRLKTDTTASLLSTTLTRVPWVAGVITLALLLGALLNPAHTPQPVLSWYEDSGLKSLEWDNYLSWLRFNGQGNLAAQLEQQLPGNPHAYSAALLSDNFAQDSASRSADFWSAAQTEQWQRLRAEAKNQRAQSNLYRWGLADSAPRPANLFSAPFTGGPLWLTLLTMMLIAPLLPGLERQLGHGRVLSLWLLGSLLAGAGYLSLARTGQTPFHGATAPLMVWYGAWLSLQGWRGAVTLSLPGRSRYRLSIPVLALVPVPLILTAILAWYSQPTLANLAAALLALGGGALLVQVMRPSALTDPISTDRAPDPDSQRHLQKGWNALATLQGKAAEAAFLQVLDRQPDHFDALTGLFTARRMLMDPAAWRDAGYRLLMHPAQETGQPQQVAACWQQFQQHQMTELPAHVGWALVNTLTRAGDYGQAENLASRLDHHDSRKPALTALREALQREGLGHRAKALEV